LKFHNFCQSLNGTTAKYSVPAMAMPILDDIAARRSLAARDRVLTLEPRTSVRSRVVVREPADIGAAIKDFAAEAG
jgi:hypothetical protein